MPLNVYDRAGAFCHLLYCLAFSFCSLRRTIHLMRHSVVTGGHLIVAGNVRFVTIHGITLEFHSQIAPDKISTNVPMLYDPTRPSIADKEELS